MTKRVAVGAVGSLGLPARGLGRRASVLEKRGFDSIFWPDHLMGWLPESIWVPDVAKMADVSPSANPHVFLDPVTTIATAAAHTDRVLLGTCVTDPIRRHPAMLASEFLSLHHLSGGRAILGIGAGEGENTIPYGIDFSYQTSKLEEALQVIRLLWESDGPVDFDGKWFSLSGAVMGLGAYEGTFPQIWVGALGPRMCEIAGAYGDGWLPVTLPIEEYRTRVAWINQSRRAHGRLADPFVFALRSYVAMGEDHDEVHRLLEHPLVKGLALSLPDWLYKTIGAEHPLGDGFHGLRSYIPAGMPKATALELIDRIPFDVIHRYMLHGTPDEIVDDMTPYVEAGASHVILLNLGYLADPRTLIRSDRLFSEVVEVADAAFNRSVRRAV
ncbi:MAG: LLM class flavin-dependent oxidoreductase [Actinomycetota bacterium]